MVLNSVSVLMYSMFGVIFSKARGVDDDINTVASGTLTGVLYKSTGMAIYKFYLLHRTS